MTFIQAESWLMRTHFQSAKNFYGSTAANQHKSIACSSSVAKTTLEMTLMTMDHVLCYHVEEGKSSL